ncbi:LiaI-LiaF-like domain-containing protein [Halalkalibacterium ligniniphilum]|uniref:LiaI-LiaF-like domain-containing protein n=1 Tax=Halalkalibacterium ligniniphilum TaxID=1134413 RepID=UPI00034DA8AE|nr:DUF5668 domain-containing protein [Halalkalibacterium ligniniphilum]
MKQQRVFTGVLLTGLGGYFLLQQYPLPYREQLLTWPSIFVLLGLAFSIQFLFSRDNGSLFPGLLLLGLGLHYHGIAFFPFWPSHWAMLTLILGLSYSILYLKTKQGGLGLGLALLLFSLFMLFSTNVFLWSKNILTLFDGFWPFALILFGVFLLMRRR